MEYGIRELSELAGVSSRTLRYYDEIRLLSPSRTNDAGYRFYDEEKVELLQQILFYRERGFGLEQIRNILYQTDFDILSALYDHLRELENQKKRVDGLISIVEKTILVKKGEVKMSDRERFEALKKGIIQENDKRYGKEAREKYGERAVEETKGKMMKMTEEEYHHFRTLENEILLRLKEAVMAGKSAESEEGENLALLHKEWLKMTWSHYSKLAHQSLVEMYVMDERFLAYYDREVKGCGEFLRKAVEYWIDKL